MEDKNAWLAGLSNFPCFPNAQCELVSACQKLQVHTNIFMFGSKSFITCSPHGGRGKIPPTILAQPLNGGLKRMAKKMSKNRTTT